MIVLILFDGPVGSNVGESLGSSSLEGQVEVISQVYFGLLKGRFLVGVENPVPVDNWFYRIVRLILFCDVFINE